MLSSLNELAEGQSGRGEAGCWNEMCLPIFTAIPRCSLSHILQLFEGILADGKTPLSFGILFPSKENQRLNGMMAISEL